MSYLSDALDAFDALSEREWLWFRPRRGARVSRDQFREVLRTGRVDPRLVLRNAELAKATEVASQRISALLSEKQAMPILRKGGGWVPVLEVVE